ncbi:hypothetical protein IV203_003842 [Nitzschia inconspicua]|uniref:Uncharacterized protein n=1 Tax=Nitzschia inconspicua TaxID=303405 RepID=A0A9K3L479_9STRA|nr:hypothetical protein IV203_003842 [Nitzschia inconspicua]
MGIAALQELCAWICVMPATLVLCLSSVRLLLESRLQTLVQRRTRPEHAGNDIMHFPCLHASGLRHNMTNRLFPWVRSDEVDTESPLLSHSDGDCSVAGIVCLDMCDACNSGLVSVLRPSTARIPTPNTSPTADKT